MARRDAARPRVRRSTWIGAAAVTAAVAVITTLAVVWPGYDAQQTPPDNPTVWALQNGAGSGYARVNLELGEIDTVKQVDNGSQIAQTGDRLFVYSDGGSQFSDVDMGRPADLTDDLEDAFAPTPPGTSDIATAGDHLAYRTEAGAVFGSSLSGGGDAVPIDPYAEVEVAEGEERPRFVAAAVTVDPSGTVYAYSAEESRIVRADARTGRILGEDATPDAPEAAQLTAVGGTWVLIDDATGDVWIRGRDEPVAAGIGAGSRVQDAAGEGDAVHVADADGLVRIDLGDGQATRVVDQPGSGTPARPAVLGSTVHAAWLADGESSGSLWSSAAPDTVTTLDYRGADIGENVDPSFVGNGTRLALNDRRSGWVWSVPSGELIASSQQWDLEQQTQVEQQEDATSERVVEPKPPVAVDDAFGVRPGSVTLLPVLLNDHDPNEDVLSIDVASLENLDPAFGTATVTGAQQQLTVAVSPEATGSATLRYRVTDGTTADGLLSDYATVTLTVVPDEQNTAPAWCGVEECLATWPSLTVAPGGTVSAELLEGWVDPEGDPVFLAGATNDTGVGTVTTSPQGTLTYQHPDPNATEGLAVSIAVTVSDARGATTTQPLSITVTPTPELTAESFAVTGVVGEPLDISVAPYVTGAAGPVTLTGAVALDEGRSTAAANPAALSMVVTASAPGSYLVQYSVRDALTEATATVRVTMQAPESAVITTPPLTAFVRPNEDATIDVAAAVSNPAGLVLLLSDIQPESDPFASLGVDLVGQSLLRVSGTTDTGAPGRLGVVRYTVSDGTGNAAATAQGELTVVLLPAATAEPPIAVDDAVTVRAGTQIDIPVLDNDTAPSGALIAIDPSSIVNETGGGLAFATNRVLRYLAPDEAGTYALTYTIFRLGFPEVTDTARVTVTVVGNESNQAPLPRTLVGRVLSGQSISIPLDGYAVDPDGDPVTLDRIVSQPEQGSATISADGSAIVYTSPEGFSGQVRFSYAVRDPSGATGTADVRVGVIDTQADPSPVTYSDYVQVQVGAESAVVVRPTDNDIDPAGSELELVEVRPNAQEGSAEYDTLQALIGSVDAGAVTLRAGEVLGTFSYTYTVRNDRGDTAIGLIVVKVVREPVPDYPIVRDTVLTVETRDDFPTGVDVLDGQVSWNTGDVSGLRLSLWGDPDDVAVDGWKISGELPEKSRLIPFEVTGTAFDGTEVTSYGFLRVPGDADVRLALREGFGPVEVREKESVDIDLAEAVRIPRGATLVLEGAGVRAGGARGEATCTAVSGTTVRYAAGAGAPWTDSCVVPVRLETQEVATYLTVRVSVEAEIPQPTLRSASLTVSPGSTQTYDLAQMVQWAGAADWDAVQYAASYGGDQFAVEVSGNTATVTAADTARPGRQEPVALTLPSHPDAPAANLLLTVGPAPSTLPKGGSAVQTCSQSGGSTSCTIEVIGAGGEVNPLPGTPLRVVGASGPGNCTGVSFSRASDTAVRATWQADAPGAGECTGSFTVEDAQGRQSSGERNGQVILDLQGLPANPARLEWTAYAGESVTLRVSSDGGSYPAVQGYRITAGGREVATCPASGACGPISAPVGEKITYEARAFSSVGESRSTVRAEAWAYRPPAQPGGSSFEPTPNGRDGGRATITVTGLDATTGSVRLTGGRQGSDTRPVVGGTATFTNYDVGSNTATALTATPLTTFDLPPIAAGSTEGQSRAVTAHGVGAPGLTLTETNTSNSVRVTASVAPNGDGTQTLIGFSDVSAAACVPNGTATSQQFPAEAFRRKTVWACAEHTFNGKRGFGVTGAEITARPVGNVEAPDGITFSVNTQPSSDGTTFTYGAQLNRPTDPPFPDAQFRLLYNGGTVSDFTPGYNSPVTGWSGRWCDTFLGFDATCSDPSPIGPASSNASFPVQVSANSLPSCRSDQPSVPPWSPPGLPSGTYSVASEAVGGEGAVQKNRYTVTWTGPLAGLQRLTLEQSCEPITPEPQPTPTDSSAPPAP
ncbi:Ig-like domain-containing protein [Microbacterium thalli]|uniref:Ig-like domain-containing protein n=1 Tax=Microbacterium thalli TaxID=3027921 RepID=UPI00236629EA|nr:Ig-like domain-containing protein [Microbacterium thalli]